MLSSNIGSRQLTLCSSVKNSVGVPIKTDQDDIDLIHCNSLAGEFFQYSFFMCQ